MYQQELYEMLWLELQAWQAGLDSSTYDIQLVSQRHEVMLVIPVFLVEYYGYCDECGPPRDFFST